MRGKCARPSCPNAADPKKNRGYCESHYLSLPVRGYVDSTVARERIELLRSRGVTLRMLAEHGVSRFGVRCIEKKPRIRRLTEQKVLAIPVPAPLVSGAPVDATGTRRRIQALVAMGWPQSVLAKELGTTQTGVSAWVRRDKVTSETAIAVAELFRRWGMTPGPSQLSRDRARANGWVTGAAWDDIDDPDEKPDLGEHVVLKFPDRVRELRELGYGDVQIAARLGVKVESFERQLDRYKLRRLA